MAPATDSRNRSADGPKAVPPDVCPNCGRGHASPSCPPQDLLEAASEIIDELHELNESVGAFLEDIAHEQRRIREYVERFVDIDGPIWEGVSVLNGGLAGIRDAVDGKDPPDLGPVECTLGDMISAVEGLPARIAEARGEARRPVPRRPRRGAQKESASQTPEEAARAL